MTMQSMVEVLEANGFKVSKKYRSLNQGYEFNIEKNGMGVGAFFHYPAKEPSHVKDKLQTEFIKKIIEQFEQESKKSMKNIAFDISRDGPVGELVIKDNVYDVCVKEVDSYSSPYDTNTVLKVEVSGKNLFEPKCVTRTDSISAQFEAYKKLNLNCATPYEPYYRKDSINEGKLQIKNVIFNPPATIVFWSDDSKTVVKAENEMYDPEKGLAMAIAKRAMGNQGNYFETFKKYVDPYKKKVEEEFAKFAAEHADKFDRVNAMSPKQLEEALKNRPYRIWYEVFNTAYEPAGSGMYHKEYKRRGDAVRVAKKRYGDETTFRWMVSQENPWANGEWAKKFGSDS